MFSIWVWCGNLTTRCARPAPNQLSVYTKLSNKCLGVVYNPFAKGCVTFASSYEAMRDLQDQVALLLKHDYLPSRYLVLYAGEVRLTEPNFPFVTHLDLDDQAQVCHVLKDAQSISVVYFIDQSCAEASLKARCLVALWTSRVNRLEFYGSAPTQPVLALPELEVWAFTRRVTWLVFAFEADKLGTLEYFPHLTRLEMSLLFSGVKIVNFTRLAATCKMLDTLILRLQESSPSALHGVGHLCNLKYLCIQGLTLKDAHFVETSLVVIPDEVGKLVKLTDLVISGWQFGGSIPKELGRLTQLKRLALTATHLSGSIPTELGLLSNLTRCDLSYNPDLCGIIPHGLRKLAGCIIHYTVVQF